MHQNIKILILFLRRRYHVIYWLSKKYSTANGLPNVLKRDGYLNKIFWLIFSLLATSLSVYFSLTAINDFLSYRFITQIENTYQQPLRFPTITICDDGTKDNGTLQTVEYFSGKSPSGFIEECNTMQDSINCTGNKNYYFEMLRYVKTGDYGTCFTNNQSISFLSSTIGGPNDYIEIIFKESLRLKIFLHDVNFPPNLQYYNIFEPYIKINFNLSYFIGIDKLTENKLGLPYNNCYNDVTDFNSNKTIIDYIKSINQTYTQLNCLKLCFELKYIENNLCNCSNTTLGRVWRDCFKVKEKMSSSGCTNKYKRNFSENSLVEKCAEYCPLECDSTIYKYSSSSSYDDNHENKTAIRFFYNSLKVTNISQIPKTQMFDLISIIGGTFSLFIGFSFVTFFELTEIFILILLSLFQKSNRIEKIENENKTEIINFKNQLKIELNQLEEKIENENIRELRIKNEILSEVKNQLKIELDKSLKLKKKN